jgi:hypothetical protein
VRCAWCLRDIFPSPVSRLAMIIPANPLPADAVPTVAGSHMTLFRPTQPRIPGDGSSPPGEVSKIHLIILHVKYFVDTQSRNAKTAERVKTWQMS